MASHFFFFVAKQFGPTIRLTERASARRRVDLNCRTGSVVAVLSVKCTFNVQVTLTLANTRRGSCSLPTVSLHSVCFVLSPKSRSVC